MALRPSRESKSGRKYKPPQVHTGASTAPPEPLWTVHECALYLKKTPQAIYSMVSRGQIPYLKIGVAVRFDPRQIQAWIQQFTVEPDSRYLWRQPESSRWEG